MDYAEVKRMPVEQWLSDYYLLERLVADGSRSARNAQRKLEAYAAPRLMRYLAAVSGGELRHYGGGSSGCDGWSCEGIDGPEEGTCSCCGYDEDGHENYCRICGGAEGMCEFEEDEEGNEVEHDEDPANDAGCECYCPYEGLCYDCEQSQECGSLDDLPGKLYQLDFYHGDDRSEAWEEWHQFHEVHGNKALRWMEQAFRQEAWEEGYGGDSWAFIVQVAAEYAEGKMTAHAFMDRCWTLHHNGGNVFDKMYDDYTINRILRKQANDDYRFLVRYASPEAASLWEIRTFVLSDSLDRDPVWMGRSIPQGVEW